MGRLSPLDSLLYPVSNEQKARRARRDRLAEELPAEDFNTARPLLLHRKNRHCGNDLT
jgi:hypothetical protein